MTYCSLRGEINLCSDNFCADKSISHRALIIASIAQGQSIIHNLSNCQDVLKLKNALLEIGANIDPLAASSGSCSQGSCSQASCSQNDYQITGLGLHVAKQPTKLLDMGNSGTALRLMLGLMSSYNIKIGFTGDASLGKRPMDRVLQPLREMGAQYQTETQLKRDLSSQNSHYNWDNAADCAENKPIADRADSANWAIKFMGNPFPTPINWHMQQASAQVKSAIMLAALNCHGETTIYDPFDSRDHSELMLQSFGADISIEKGAQKLIKIRGNKQLRGCDIRIPGDFSAAAFFIVGSLITPGSEIKLHDIGINKTRTGLLDALWRMGGNIKLSNIRYWNNEKIADITVASSKLRSIETDSALVPHMIDEYPILAIAAACATGCSIFRNLKELRYKESDRLSAICKGLNANKISAHIEDNDLIIHGKADGDFGGAHIKTEMDHRIAMSFSILNLVARHPITIDDSTIINTSFPGFFDCLAKLSCRIN